MDSAEPAAEIATRAAAAMQRSDAAVRGAGVGLLDVGPGGRGWR